MATRPLGSALLPALLLTGPLPAALAAPFQQAQVRRVVDGREVWIDRRPARVADVARSGQRLSTGRSRAELLFDRRAIGFLGRSSQITLGQECFRLRQGTVLVNGPQRACLGSRVLGVRGTTYVLSHLEAGGWELSVLSGEAGVLPDTAGTAGGPDAAGAGATALAPEPDILSLYPRINPILGVAASGYAGLGSSELNLNGSSGNDLLVGEVNVFAPLRQLQGRNLLYSYTAASGDFGDFWGVSSEVGFRWYDPNNTAASGVLLGYDGWRSAAADGCFHSQVAAGGEWQRRGWQLIAEGAVNVDDCVDSISYGLVGLGIPVGSVAEQPVQLSFSPYLLNALGSVTAGGRVGLSVPLSESLSVSGYVQYDDLLETVVGGRVSLRFGMGGGFVRDPNPDLPGGRSPLPWLGRGGGAAGSGERLAMAGSRPAAPFAANLAGAISDATAPMLAAGDEAPIQAGESARYDEAGQLLSRAPISRDRYAALLLANLSGQNLLPESALIARTYRRLYGPMDATLRALTGGDWRTYERTPFPRRRNTENYVVPADKLPKPEPLPEADPRPQASQEEKGNDSGPPAPAPSPAPAPAPSPTPAPAPPPAPRPRPPSPNSEPPSTPPRPQPTPNSDPLQPGPTIN